MERRATALHCTSGCGPRGGRRRRNKSRGPPRTLARGSISSIPLAGHQVACHALADVAAVAHQARTSARAGAGAAHAVLCTASSATCIHGAPHHEARTASHRVALLAPPPPHRTRRTITHIPHTSGAASIDVLPVRSTCHHPRPRPAPADLDLSILCLCAGPGMQGRHGLGTSRS